MEIDEIQDEKKREAKFKEIEDFNLQIIDLIKEYKVMKAEYTRLMEGKLFDQWVITDSNGRSKTDHSCKYAYVTFRSMYGKDKVMEGLQYAEHRANKDLDNED